MSFKVTIEILIMGEADAFPISRQLWMGLRSGDLADVFPSKGLPAVLGFETSPAALSGSDFWISVEGSEIETEVYHPCTKIAYIQDLHNDFYLIQWFDRVEAIKARLCSLPLYQTIE